MILELVAHLKKHSNTKNITDGQYLTLMNWFGMNDPLLPKVYDKFKIPSLLSLPKVKYKDALRFIKQEKLNVKTK